VPRVVSTAIVLALLAASAGAFALTERAKLERSPIYGTRVLNPVFSPAAKAKPTATIQFRVRPGERVDAWIVDSEGRKVTELISNRSVRAHEQLALVWDGLDAKGIQARDGVYRPVVKLLRSHRTITLPSNITIDTTPPVIHVKRPQFPIISPDGDGHADVFRVPYTVSEPAHAILLMRGVQVVRTRGQKLRGVLTWNGFYPHSTRPLPPGRYVLGVEAEDIAGNRSPILRFAIAQIRYVTLARDRVVARAGGRFAIRVSTDSPSVDWRLNGRSGTLPRGTLHLRAPRKRGVYRLYVTVGKHSDTAAVVVP
jgi:hypothetical protein